MLVSAHEDVRAPLRPDWHYDTAGPSATVYKRTSPSPVHAVRRSSLLSSLKRDPVLRCNSTCAVTWVWPHAKDRLDGACPQASSGAQPAPSTDPVVEELSEPLLAALPSGSMVTLRPPQLEVTEAPGGCWSSIMRD